MLGGQDFSQPVDFDALETALVAISQRVVGQVFEATLNADQSDYQGRTRACQCGGTQSYKGRYPKTFVTALGPLTLVRAYYHCRGCGCGTHPRDDALGLTERTVSPAVVRMIGLVSAVDSFAVSQLLLFELAQVRVSVKQVERTAERLGAKIAIDERQRYELESPPASTMYLGMDGTGVPVRKSQTQGRRGKHPDGSAKTREMKIVSVWSAEHLDDKGHAKVDVNSMTCSAAIESAHTPDRALVLSAFAQRVEREALRRGFYDAPVQVVIGDGALWIWKICAEIFPKALQIVDIWHAKEKLWDLGKAIYGVGTELAKQWSKARIVELKAGEIETLVQTLQSFSVTHPEALQVSGYFERNCERMRYAQFRSQGLCVSSAVVESGCKNVIGARLKKGGMHWNVTGANDIGALRSCVKSNRFDDYWYQQMVD